VTGLRPALAGYLELRRGLGFKLDRDAKLLDQFITYLEQHGTGTITVAGATETRPPSGDRELPPVSRTPGLRPTGSSRR
jgi:integrase/recombinase XerD